MRIQHPRATDAFARGPPSRAAVPTGEGSYVTKAVGAEGYVEIADEHAEAAMDGLESAYDVEYNRETGDVVGADPAAAPEGGGDEPPDQEAADVEHGAVDEDGNAEEHPESDSPADEAGNEDLEAWANWNEEDWLALGYQQRVSDVEDGLVDEHLEEIIGIETSSNVEDAAKARLEELEG